LRGYIIVTMIRVFPPTLAAAMVACARPAIIPAGKQSVMEAASLGLATPA
jgi:hypothetical protein